MPRRLAIASVGIAVTLVLAASDFASAWQDVATDAARAVSADSPTGTRAYAGGHWGPVEVQAVNRSDEPATVASSIFFDGDANLQYGREIWLPGRSKRRTSYPAFVPEQRPDGPDGVAFESILYDRTGDRDRHMTTAAGQMIDDGLLQLDREDRLTCSITRSGPDDDRERAEAINQLVAATRIHAGLSRRVSGLRGLTLPSGAESLDGVHSLVISSDRPLHDAAGLIAIRDWVHRGGRLWLVLNDISPELIERLFGNHFRLQVVDRVGLTSVTFDGLRGATNSIEVETREFEQPIEMVRVVCDDADVLHTVNGWPASLTKSIGRGTVLVTTVESRAWLRPRDPFDPEPADQLGSTPFVAGRALSQLSEQIYILPTDSVPATAAWQPLLAEQIGHRVVGRGTVLAILGLFCVVLIAAAVGFSRRGRLDRLGWAAPLASVVTAATLAFAGLRSTESVPSTVAEGQFIETAPGSTAVHATGMAILYNQSPSEGQLAGDRGGVLVPDMTGFAGEVRRMMWNDWNRWHWEHLTLPAGMRVATFQQDTRLPAPVEATAAFGPTGLAGTVAGWPDPLEDLVLATPTGVNLAPRKTGDGHYVASPDEILAEGAYSQEALMDDVQRRRQNFLHTLLTGESVPRRFDERPTLLAWSKPLDLGFQYPENVTRKGDALVVLPLTITRTPPATDVVVASAFVGHTPVPRPDGRPPSPLFNRRAREWVEYTGDIESWLRFQMPQEVVPLDLDQLDVSLVASGALIELELLAYRDGAVTSLRTWRGPTGTLRHVIERDALPPVDSDGGVTLGFRMTGVPLPDERIKDGIAEDSLRQYWRVAAIRVDAAGRTRERQAAP